MEVNLFLDSARIGQSEAGSYVIVVTFTDSYCPI